MTGRRGTVARLLCLTLALALAGCGAAGHRVKGRVVKGGQPIPVGGRGLVQVIFVPLPAPGEHVANTYPANAQKDGTFEVAGPQGRGIPAGKYRVAVLLADPYPSDRFKGAFGIHNSPLTCVVPVTGDDLVLDLDGP